MLKVSGPNLLTYLNRTLIFELVRCGSKYGHQNNICSKDIGLCAQNLLTILGSFVNIIGGTYMIVLGKRSVFTLAINKIFI